MNLRFLFICNELSGFATYKDTTFAMMRETQHRGIEIHVAQAHELRAETGPSATGLSCFAHHIRLEDPQSDPWWIEHHASWRPATDFSAILMRTDPPFDQNYLVATQLLELAERQGVPVINSPRTLRDHGEKMAALEFPQLTPPTLISSDLSSLRGFAAHYQKIVVKPLDAMGGKGIFVLEHTDPNLPSALELLTHDGQQAIVAQRFIPEISHGDKRIILIDGKPIEQALARIPPPGQSRGNLAAGGKGVAQPLSPRDREIALTVGEKLAPRGLLLIGLDVIGDYLTEINVTSPTGFQEITQQTGIDVAARFIDAVQSSISASGLRS